MGLQRRDLGGFIERGCELSLLCSMKGLNNVS